MNGPDAVLSYHLNPATCGVAKFNQRLARELGVPCLDLDKHPVCYPIVSVKSAEIDSGRGEWPTTALWYRRFDLFLHDAPRGLCANGAVTKAERVYAANPVVAQQTREQTGRQDIIEGWCPSTIQGNPHRGTINVLTFGMAHKIQTLRYAQLKALLDASGQNYTVSVSTAIHEGSPWDETAHVGERLVTVFGGRLRVLGYLADDALARELSDCTAVALFFEPALRANNTTFWAAYESGRPIITNLDSNSPMVSGIQDIDCMSTLLDGVRSYHPAGFHTWPDLIHMIRQEQPCGR